MSTPVQTNRSGAVAQRTDQRTSEAPITAWNVGD
jgi:hypothetical protein